MGDGAHQGVSAGRALVTILGGDPAPEAAEQRTPDRMREWLLASGEPPFTDDMAGYDECARYVGKVILELFLADPRMAAGPTETDYDWDADPDRGAQGMKPEYVRALGLYERMKQSYPEQYEKVHSLGITGFMWGWAVNAARYCVELPPAENPALIDL